MSDELVELIGALVSIDSVNPGLVPDHPGETEIALFIAEWGRARGLEVEWLEGTQGRPSVIVTAPGSGGGRNLLFNGHTDTVGVDGMSAPFTPRIEGGRLYGRGAMDMKASLAACLLTVAAAKEQGLSGAVSLAAVSDEENDSIGSRELVAEIQRTSRRVDAVLVAEPSDLDVHVAHRGFAVMEVGLTGRASHTSQPAAGVNAVRHMGLVLAAIEAQARALEDREPHPLLGHGSLQPVLAKGGKELFTTPASAELTVERRSLPGETTTDLERELEELLERVREAEPAFVAQSRTLVARDPFELLEDDPLLPVLAASAATVTGVEPVRLGAPYWTDAALFTGAGIPTLLYGPAGGGIHQPGEWVDLDSVRQFKRVLDLTVHAFCS